MQQTMKILIAIIIISIGIYFYLNQKPNRRVEIRKAKFEQEMRESKERLQELKDSLDFDAKMKKMQ